MDGLDKYKNEFPKAWENFQNDSNLSKKAQDAFVRHLKNYKNGDIQDYSEDFFFNPVNQLKGPKAVLHKNEVLGRVVSKSLFNDYIDLLYRALSKGTAPSLKGTAAFSAHILPPSDRKLKNLIKHLGTETLSNYNMWSFRNKKDPKYPFKNGIALTDIPCVLGLKDVAPPFYRLEYTLPHDAYVPTAFDAATNEAWQPSGRTRPLPKCIKKYKRGLPEIIHKPNFFRNLVKPLEDFN